MLMMYKGLSAAADLLGLPTVATVEVRDRGVLKAQ
jgi:hypothetical protein